MNTRRGIMPKPDFTGTWRFNHDGSVLQIPAPDATIFVIDHCDPKFGMSRTHVVGETRDTFALDLTTDGQLVLADRDDLQLRSRAHWDGDTLVFDATFTRGGKDATNVVRYSLSDDEKTMIAEECFRSETINYDNLWRLDKVVADEVDYEQT